MADILDFNDGAGKKARPFKKEPDGGLSALVWVCLTCSNSTFQLLEDGGMRCACCNTRQINHAHFRPDDKQ